MLGKRAKAEILKGCGSFNLGAKMGRKVVPLFVVHKLAVARSPLRIEILETAAMAAADHH
jgi:hypothetical protein